MNDFQNTTHPADEAFDNIIAEGKAAAEQKRTAEVGELLDRAKLTREDIEPVSEIGRASKRHETVAEFPGGEPYTISTEPPVESIGPDWADALADQYKAAEAKDVHPAGLNGTANRIADELVPEFGATLEKYEPGALAYGFPPAVDALIHKAKLDETRTNMVLANFREAFTLATRWENKARAIIVTDECQTDLIKEAKDMHKIVRDERISVEKKRKEIKDPALRECQLIDGVSNVYKSLLEPIETHLRNQATFVERKEAERKAKLVEVRSEKLRLFEVDPTMFPNLGDMNDEAFEVVYSGVRENYHRRKEEEKEAERLRVERERAAEIENERLRKENEVLEAQRKAEAERAAEQQRIAEQAEARRREAQAELDRQAAEREADARRQAEIERAKRLAPDREKLLAFADAIDALECADLTEETAKAVLAAARHGLDAVASTIRKSAATL